MKLELHIIKDSGAVYLEGGASASAALRLADTLDLVVSFMDSQKNVIELPSGALGTLMLKRQGYPLEAPRILKDGWAVSGTGTGRRYTFSMRVFSAALQQDLVADASTAYVLQVEWRTGGKPYNCDNVPTLVALSYIQPGDVPPPVPTMGFPVEWAREVFGPAENVVSDTRWAGNLLLGGPLESIRLSMEDYQPGVLVQLQHNGTDILFAPKLMTSQSLVIGVDDSPNIIVLSNLLAGARIDVVTSFDSGDYPTHAKGLQVELQVIGSQTSALDTAPTAAYLWLKSKLIEGANFTITPNDDDEELTIAAAAGGTTVTVVGNFLRFSYDGKTWECPVNEVV